MARGSGDSLLTFALLGVGGYLVYQWMQAHPTTAAAVNPNIITPQTYSGPVVNAPLPTGWPSINVTLPGGSSAPATTPTQTTYPGDPGTPIGWYR